MRTVREVAKEIRYSCLVGPATEEQVVEMIRSYAAEVVEEATKKLEEERLIFVRDDECSKEANEAWESLIKNQNVIIDNHIRAIRSIETM